MTEDDVRFVWGHDRGLGLISGSPAAGWQLERSRESPRIHEIHVTSQAESGGPVLYAGTRGGGALVSRDLGSSWQALAGLKPAIVRSFLMVQDRLLVGTEPARLFRRDHGHDHWDESPSFLDVPGASAWFTPYSEHAGATRTLAADPHQPGRVLAGIEVGGLLESRQRGKDWQRIGDGIHQDVHHLEPDPSRPGRFFAATAGGVFRSVDGGATWQHISSGMDGQYTRAVSVHPRGGERLVTAVSPQVGGAVRLYVSHDAGDSWDEAGHGLPGRTAFINRFTWGADGAVYALTTAGQWLRGAGDLEGAWQVWPLDLQTSPWGAVAVTG